MSDTKKILIQYAHPNPEKSRINERMIQGIADLPQVRINHLYELYPDFHIDVQREQQLLNEAELLIFHFPFYWHSSPAILKEWQDVVLQHGFAYGDTGNALLDKEFMLAISTGGAKESYQRGGKNNYTLEELLRPFEQSARLCKMAYLNPFVVQGTYTLTAEEIAGHVRNYRNFLSNYKRDLNL